MLLAIEETGLSPYEIEGDPIAALLAQLNRFANKTVSIGTCSDNRYVREPFSLMQEIDSRAATAAVVILNQRYACVPLGAEATREARWARSGYDNPEGFVMANLEQITTIIAQAGDAAGLDPASVGITKVDPKLKPKGRILWWLGGLTLVAGLVAYSKYRKHQ